MSAPEVSRRASGMPVQSIREVMELAWARPGTIHLEVGEPDFPTPPHIVEAADRAARDGHTRYTPNAGIPPLREALAAKVARVNGYEVGADQVVVTAGGVEALHATLLALTDPGEEVLLPDPAWPDFVQMVALLDTPPRFYHQAEETDFLPAIEELEELVGPRTRVLVVNSPSNPLGAVVPRERMAELIEFAERHDLWLVSDECYDEVAFDGVAVSPLAVAASPRTVAVYSFSKVYAMTGWRIGYAVAPPAVAAVLTRLQEPLISCVNAPTQMAALAAVEGPQEVVASMRDAYRDRRDHAVEALGRGGLPVRPPAGAFYLWVPLPAGADGTIAFVRDLIEARGVAVAPGPAFGAAGHGFVRLSLAAELDQLLEGIERLSAHVGELVRT